MANRLTTAMLRECYENATRMWLRDGEIEKGRDEEQGRGEEKGEKEEEGRVQWSMEIDMERMAGSEMAPDGWPVMGNDEMMIIIIT